MCRLGPAESCDYGGCDCSNVHGCTLLHWRGSITMTLHFCWPQRQGHDAMPKYSICIHTRLHVYVFLMSLWRLSGSLNKKYALNIRNSISGLCHCIIPERKFDRLGFPIINRTCPINKVWKLICTIEERNYIYTVCVPNIRCKLCMYKIVN